jgi:6-phosphogluconate dehydrogenase
MQIGMIGLGRMGANMVRRLLGGGHECAVYDVNPASVQAIAAEGARPSKSLEDLASQLRRPRAVWIMVPAGQPTEDVILELANIMEPGDVVIDGGNSYFKDDVRRSRLLAQRGIRFADAGTSGGVRGLERGYCLMVGAEPEVFEQLVPIFRTLAPGRGDIPRTPSRGEGGAPAEEGYLHCGPVGAGHFVKMVHNGIEYGLMQSYAEGFDIMRNAGSPGLPAEMRYDLPLADIAEVWRRGSVISSWLLDLAAAALAEDPGLSRFAGSVQDSGEGRWAILAAIEETVPAEVLSSALFTRFRSRQDHTFAEKVLSAMRFQFGGHKEVK